MFIPFEDYAKIIGQLPILCIDVMIESDGEYLLLKRDNPPLAGTYWTPGGRVERGETLALAAKRKVEQETGLQINTDDLEFVGIYEDQFTDNMFGADFIHTVSAVFHIKLNERPNIIKLDNQSDDFVWSANLPERLKILKAS